MNLRSSIFGAGEDSNGRFSLSVASDMVHEIIDRTGFGEGSYNREHGHNQHAVCPWCNGAVSRVPRRLGDRFASLISPRHRYRCESWVCKWEGTLPLKP